MGWPWVGRCNDVGWDGFWWDSQERYGLRWYSIELKASDGTVSGRTAPGEIALGLMASVKTV